ncbi:right-handed parallel beta-helix repeat-containing protein [Halorussus lipolyticus]|uniref:right-handed parallel beta-helix repeat-containing protein n=1 Tax=Halorussus lipolyticus TaxID=3034024 RepID=UPI0023E791A9|nr:right-handed parallel beta-helix repeat-containing protein [Halorussus sp. DT80]
MSVRDARGLGVLLVAVAVAVGGSAVVGAVPSGAGPAGGVPSGAVSPSKQAPTGIDSCTTIDEPGEYVLTTDIENGGKTAISKACITITADDVTFDGGDHRIDGRGVSHTKGVHVRDAEEVTVENVEVDDWHSGLLVTGGSATIRNVTTFSNAYGVRLERATDVRITDSIVTNNLVGVYTDTESLTLDGTEFSENGMEIKRDY